MRTRRYFVAAQKQFSRQPAYETALSRRDFAMNAALANRQRRIRYQARFDEAGHTVARAEFYANNCANNEENL
jgi:hypothetical protein